MKDYLVITGHGSWYNVVADGNNVNIARIEGTIINQKVVEAALSNVPNPEIQKRLS